MLAAILDNVLGGALAARLEPGQFVVTLELKTGYIHPAKVATLAGEGRALNIHHRQGGQLALPALSLLRPSES
jgi:acyl-coenzyme A thioesterase PaaI-like protein